MSSYIFFVFAALIVVSSIFILFTRNILYAALSLFFCFLGVSAMYVFASADFLAITQLVIYIGGVLVLLLFGIMLTNRVSSVKELVSGLSNRFSGFLIGGILLGGLVFGIHSSGSTALFSSLVKDVSVIESIGIQLMTNYLLPFEIAGILLLVVLVGTIYLIDKKDVS
ncbi:MAG: NADH-quinone oxidoreductase subunit J [Cyclobacteriaceae bacterium]